MSDLIKIQDEVKNELSNPEVFKALLETTFKGLKPETMKLAIMDGMIRGFTFKDFRERNVYAIPFGANYSLVTSIDYARKIGMRSGVVFNSEPVFEMDGDKIVSCSVTVKRKVGNDIGEFTAKVYFDEYAAKNLWVSKPRTMIAKVAEMHALRKACPEELAQSYAEEEIDQKALMNTPKELPIEEYNEKLMATKDISELKSAWASLPTVAKLNDKVKAMKESMKKKFEIEEKAANELPNINEDPELSSK